MQKRLAFSQSLLVITPYLLSNWDDNSFYELDRLNRPSLMNSLIIPMEIPVSFCTSNLLAPGFFSK